MKRGFGSDNHAAVHPRIMQALQSVNFEHAPSYGTDEWTESAIVQFKKHFGQQASVYFVFNGTAANVLCLRAATKPWQSVLCTDVSHINVDECGAPEQMAGCKLWPLPHKNGKLTIDSLECHFIRRGDQHFSQASVVSLTQPTELGTIYSVDELKKIIAWAKERKLLVHMDGARIAGAATALNLPFHAFTTDLGVDIISFGGTKNSLMFGEAVIILNPKLNQDFKYIRKQSSQLPSKSRYIAAQFSAYFQDQHWQEISLHCQRMAQLLYEQIKDIAHVQITQPVQNNALFVIFPKEWIKPLREKYFFYVWDENTFECRLMMSWDTQIEDIQEFVTEIKRLSQQ